MRQGWDPRYKIWVEHGEPAPPTPPPVIFPPNNEHNEPTQGDIGETSNEPTQATRNEFEELYASANEELYPGCDYVTRLDFMAKFTYFKAKGRLTDSIFNEMLEFFQNVFPISKGFKLPPSLLCINERHLKRTGLQRLYKSSHTAKEMIWHATGKCTEPEPRNVRLGLAADGFNPLWQTLVRPTACGGDIDNIQSASVDLKVLWDRKGVETIDVATGQKFNMRAMVLWTINDFPARSLFPNKDMQEEFPTGFGSQIRQRHVDNDQDLEVSTTNELFALANGPSWTPISVNSCVVDGVRYVVHNRDERRTTQNSGICSPGPDGEMYYDVARSHGGDGGGDDRPPSHVVPTGCGGCFANKGKAKGPVSISFDVGDKQTLNPLGPHAAHWSNYIEEVVRSVPLYYPSWEKVPKERKAAIISNIGVSYPFIPCLTSGRTWNPPAGQRSTKASTCTCKKPTIPTRLLSRPSIGRQTPPPRVTMWRLIWGHCPEEMLQRVVTSRQGSRSLARLRDEMRQASDTQDYPSLIDTFWRTHTVDGVFPKDEDRRIYEEMKRLEATGEYTEDEINALAGVDFMMSLFRSDSKYSDMFKEFESGGASGSGGCGDDEESGDDEEGRG
ncbi:secretory carrier-associated membrane protein 4 [Tanacetum coccineum]